MLRRAEPNIRSLVNTWLALQKDIHFKAANMMSEKHYSDERDSWLKPTVFSSGGG